MSAPPFSKEPECYAHDIQRLRRGQRNSIEG
jgi:hypothetical protein